MNWWQAILLGILQGLTEFLPVSSSGHLVLAQKWLALPEAGLLLEVVLHLGTLAAVVFVYWKDVWRIVRHPFKSDLRFLIIATIPAVLAALLLGDFIDSLFAGKFLWIGFFLTTAVLYFGDKLAKPYRNNVTALDGAVMGLTQAVAIVPGLSRSGSTISAGVARGLSRKEAARFSFLMSIPAILGSLALELLKIFKGEALPEQPFSLLLGAVFAAVFGLIAINFMLNVLMKRGLKPFALYTGIMAAAAFITFL